MPLMKRLAVPNALAAQPEGRRSQQRQRLGLSSLIRLITAHELFEFRRQEAADARTSLCRKGPRSLQQTPVNGEGDLLLHGRLLLLRAGWPRRLPFSVCDLPKRLFLLTTVAHALAPNESLE